MRGIVSIGLAVWASLFLATACYGQPPDVELTLEQQPGAMGEKQYQISAVTFRLGLDRSLVSPSGARFGSEGVRSIGELAFEDLGSELFGLWTIEDEGFFSDDDTEIHNFSIEPFELNDVFSETPIVVSPTDGDVVTTGFVFDWEYEAGVVEPRNRIVRTSRGAGIDDSSVTFGDGTEVTFDVTLEPGSTSGSLGIRAGSFEDLSRLVSPVTTTVVNPRSSFTAELTFQNLSNPVGVTVIAIPEPGSGALLVVFGAIFGCSRNRLNV